MRNPQRGVLVLALALGGLLGAEAADLRDGTVTLGGVTVALPAPVGFRPLTTETAVTKAMSPDGPRRLATFYSDSDLDRALRGQKDGAALAFNRWYMASVSRELENVRATLREFQEFKEEYRGQQVQLITQLEPRLRDFNKRVSTNMSADFDTSITANIGEPVPLGIVSEDSRSISSALLMQVSVSEDGQTRANTVVGVTSVVFVKGKLLFLYTYSTLQSPKDLEWAKQAAQEWVAQVTGANRPKSGSN